MVSHVRAVLDAGAMPGGVCKTDNCEKRKGIELIKAPTRELYRIEALFLEGCGNWFSLTQRPPQE